MSLKCILSAVLLVVGVAAFSAENTKTGTGLLAGEIANVLRDKKFPASVVAGKPAAAVEQLRLLNNKDAQATALLGICYKEGFGVKASLPLPEISSLRQPKWAVPSVSSGAVSFCSKGSAVHKMCPRL